MIQTEQTNRGRADRLRSSAFPLAIVGVAAVVVGFGLESALPIAGIDARRADPQADLALGLRVGGAVLVSLAACWLARGLWLDRTLVAAPDDRLASEYLAAGLLGVLISAMTGALPGVFVCAAIVFGVAAIRRSSQDPRGVPGRQLRNASMVAITGAALLLGVTETVETWARWRHGYGASERTLQEYASGLGLDLVEPVLLALALLCAIPVFLRLWKHRDRLHDLRGRAFTAAMSVFAGAALAGSAVLLWCGVAAFALVVGLLIRQAVRGS